MTTSRVNESLLAFALAAMSEGSVITDARRATIYSNKAFTEMTGYEHSEIVGLNCRFLQGPGTSPAELLRMREALDAAEAFQGTLLNYRKDGTSFWNQLSITPLKDAAGALTHFVSVQRDVTDIIQEREQPPHTAGHDQLTNLPNRRALLHHLQGEFNDNANAGSIIALGLIDLTQLRLVNDEHGYSSGDAVLRQFAARVSAVLRRGDYLARLGGDEFVIVITDLSPVEPERALGSILERIHTAVEEPFVIDGGVSLSVGMSMGVALFPSDGVGMKDLLRTADAALYRVKNSHSAGLWWELAQRVDAVSMNSVAESMGAVSASGELVMFMQPIVDLHTGRVHQVEALARIRKPDGSIEPPERFLPYCSREQLVEVFKEGLDQSLAWVSQWENDGIEMNVSVNISPELLTSPDSITWVQDALARHSVPAHRLSLELLESQELDLAASDHTVAELVRLGVKIHLDDLSSGYGTLKRITDVPFDVIKIDRQVFDRAKTRPLQLLAVLAAITWLGSDSEFAVVVEGIEDRERLEASVVLGAQFGQGYLFARPMPPEDIAQWVSQFTMPFRMSEITTPFGALAYHWSHSRESGPTHPSRESCPLTEFFAHAGQEIAAVHDELHTSAGRNSQSSAALTSWLVEQVQRSGTGD